MGPFRREQPINMVCMTCLVRPSGDVATEKGRERDGAAEGERQKSEREWETARRSGRERASDKEGLKILSLLSKDR